MVEDEMVDEYLSGRLVTEERAAFEQHFLSTPERQEKLRFGRAFNRYLSSQPAVVHFRQRASASPWAWSRPFFTSPLKIAVAALILVAVALSVWRVSFRQSEVERGLLALNAAFRAQRPLQSRISNLDYAPYLDTRGAGNEKIDQNELRRADITLSEELNKNATPAARHAVGKVHLGKKEFDKAIQQFDEARKGDSNNAQLYSDLGAAWLEKSHTEPEGPAQTSLNRSLEYLDKALALNPALPEAVFNRALCQEYLGRSKAAKDDWLNYLKLDSSSAFATEANQHIKGLNRVP